MADERPALRRIVAPETITVENAPEVKAAILDEKASAVVVLDLSATTFVDSVGTGMFVSARNRLQRVGGELLLDGVRPEVAELLRLTRLASLLFVREWAPADEDEDVDPPASGGVPHLRIEK